MTILLSNQGDEPIYEQVKRQVKAAVMTGELSAGVAMPSIRKLAQELGISVITTKRAYEELEREGFISTLAGKGSYVAPQTADFLHERRLKSVEEKIASAAAEARAYGISRQEVERMIDILFGEVEE